VTAKRIFRSRVVYIHTSAKLQPKLNGLKKLNRFNESNREVFDGGSRRDAYGVRRPADAGGAATTLWLIFFSALNLDTDMT
jgi:hypothetical protein